MYHLKPLFFGWFLLFLIQLPTQAQTNLDFSSGNFTNWTGYTWLYSTDVTSINTSKVKGIVSRRQTIISDTTAYDANTGYKLKKIPTGYKYCARLGDELKSTDSNPRCWQQSLRYTLTIDSSNALLIFKFACVLQYGSDHTAKVEPRFKLTLFDSSGDTIPDCSNYDVYSSSSYVKGFNTYTPSSSVSGKNDPIKWRDWTTVGANLSKYMGQTITIEFMACDCTGKFHFGYAYFLAYCQPLEIEVKYCNGDTMASLTAPIGFDSYSWKDSSGNQVDTSEVLNLTQPKEGDSYSCTMVSATGCTVTLSSVVAEYIPQSDFTSYMIDCKSNTVQFTNLSSTTRGTLSYLWDFGDGMTSTQKNPRHTFSTSGMHLMTLILKNPPSSCTDTLTKEVESFSPPLVGINGDSTYCPNDSVIISGYGAYGYNWSNGSTSDSLIISDPGGTYWLIGHSSTGCVSDTIYKTITEDPFWDFSGTGDTTFCQGDTSLLTAAGAYTYLWNTGDTTDYIRVSTTGSYTVKGENKRGCPKYINYNVLVYPLPDVNFTASPTTLNSKNSLLTCLAKDQNNVSFNWELGDGSDDTGWQISHNYNITNYILQYKVKLQGITQYNCMDSAYQTIHIVPFVPNVFTPNGDGVNDNFMQGLQLKIFDRNGMMLYTGEDGWDGKYHGKLVDPDTYFYTISYTYDDDPKIHVQKGYITLLR